MWIASECAVTRPECGSLPKSSSALSRVLNRQSWNLRLIRRKVLLTEREEKMRLPSNHFTSTLTVALLLGSPLAYVSASAAKNPISSSLEREETDHVRLSTPVVKAWREILVGSAVYALDDAVGTKDWLQRALIQRIEVQTGIWHIWIEPGYSVFRIYPYLSKESPQPSVYQGIVLKVKGTLSVEDLLAAIRKRTSTIKIDEYDVFGADSVSVQRYSRPRDGSGIRR